MTIKVSDFGEIKLADPRETQLALIKLAKRTADLAKEKPQSTWVELQMVLNTCLFFPDDLESFFSLPTKPVKGNLR